MSIIKKLINIIIILLCIIGLQFYVVTIPVFAAGDCELILSSIQGNKGDEVTVKMTLQSNSGLAGLQYTIKFDTSALSLVSAKKIENTFSDPIVNTENEGSIVYVFAEARSNTRTGDLLEVTFKILDGANSDNVALKLDDIMGVDNDINIVNVKTTIGGIQLIEAGNAGTNAGTNNNNTDAENNPTSNNNGTSNDNSTLGNNPTVDNKEDNSTGNSNNSDNINNSTNNTKTDKEGNIIPDNSSDKNNSDNQSNKGIIIFIIVVIVVLLAVAGYVVYNKKFKKNNDNSDNNS